MIRGKTWPGNPPHQNLNGWLQQFNTMVVWKRNYS